MGGHSVFHFSPVMPAHRTITPDELRRRFPRASASCLAANSDAKVDRVDLAPELPIEGPQGPDGGVRPKLERNSRARTVGKGKAKAGDRPRFLVRVTSVRIRLLDEDNLCVKYCLDLARYAGAIPDDAPGTTRIEARQRKPEEGEEEGTLIEVFKLPIDRPPEPIQTTLL